MSSPDELNKLEDVFEICFRDRRFPVHSVRAHSLGHALIRLYTNGEHTWKSSLSIGAWSTIMKSYMGK